MDLKGILYSIFVFRLYVGDLEIYLFFSFGFFQILFNKVSLA